jgi:hypothetical protein
MRSLRRGSPHKTLTDCYQMDLAVAAALAGIIDVARGYKR